VSPPRPRAACAGPSGNDNYCEIVAEMTDVLLLLFTDMNAISFLRAHRR
jgi:hypothetical protein